MVNSLPLSPPPLNQCSQSGELWTIAASVNPNPGDSWKNPLLRPEKQKHAKSSATPGQGTERWGRLGGDGESWGGGRRTSCGRGLPGLPVPMSGAGKMWGFPPLPTPAARSLPAVDPWERSVSARQGPEELCRGHLLRLLPAQHGMRTLHTPPHPPLVPPPAAPSPGAGLRRGSPAKAPTAFLISSALSTSVIAILATVGGRERQSATKDLRRRRRRREGEPHQCPSHRSCSYDQSCSAVPGGDGTPG